jgi:hypothetical protein
VWIILWFVFDLGAELVLEFLFEITRTLDADKVLRPFAVLWLVALGLVVGAASTFIAPHRVLKPGPFSGVSLIILPAVLGGVMELWGRSRSTHDRKISHLATWYGGMSMGLGLAAGRLSILMFVRAL